MADGDVFFSLTRIHILGFQCNCIAVITLCPCRRGFAVSVSSRKHAICLSPRNLRLTPSADQTGIAGTAIVLSASCDVRLASRTGHM